MSIEMYGTWFVNVKSNTMLEGTFRFAIQGSENADGSYPVDVGQTILIEGKRWTFSISGGTGTVSLHRLILTKKQTYIVF